MQNLPSSIEKRSEMRVKRRARTLAFIFDITQVTFLEICKSRRGHKTPRSSRVKIAVSL